MLFGGSLGEAFDGRQQAQSIRLLYRAVSGGTRENEVFIGGFIVSRFADFSASEPQKLRDLLELPLLQ